MACGMSYEDKNFRRFVSNDLYINRGSFGDVYGPCDWEKMKCAIKKLWLNGIKDIEKQLSVFLKVKSLHHKNLIAVYDVSLEPPAVYIMMEYASGGSLKKVISELKSDLPLEILMDWGIQIAEGMAYLHEINIVHRDLKSPNIVIMEADASSNPYKKTLKLTDFDQIREHYGTISMSTAGTYAWMAPDVLNNGRFSKASDVWSYGVVLWEILTRNVPYKGVPDHIIIYDIPKGKLKLEIPDSCPEIIKSILNRCMNTDKDRRPSFVDMLSDLLPSHTSLWRMALNDLLEELKLNDYYPQKLSFSEVIKVHGKSQSGCQKQYGLDIVRRLLMFDCTAVISVTTAINKRLNNTSNTGTEMKFQSISIATESWRSDNAEQNKRKLHPMDLLVVVMNCCDDFLRQVLVEKMVANKLSIPMLLPEERNGSYTLLLLALRSLVPEVRVRTRESPDSLTDTLVDIRNPVISFIRVGNLHRSKSKLVNELLNLNSFNTFFHRECPNGFAKRSVSNGSIEAAWFQSSTATEEEFNCRFFTALNLRGDARDYPKQTQFLCQSSTLTVLMVDSFESFKAWYENVLKNVDVSQTKIIVCCISSESPDEGNETNFELWNDSSGHGVISEVSYDWIGEEKMSDVDFTNDFRQTIFAFFKPEHTHSDQMLTYTNIIQRGKNIGFSLDEEKLEYKLGKASADEFVDLLSKQPPDCKQIILPLQGEPWEKIGKLEREQRGRSLYNNPDEHFIAEKETEKRRQREIQCRSLIQQNEVPYQFSLKLNLLQDQNLSYYLNSCKINLDARSRIIISNIIEEYKKEKQEHHSLMSEEDYEVKLSNLELKIVNGVIGLHHILREVGQMYEALISEEIRMKEELTKVPLTTDVIGNFPAIVARLLLMGHPLELMDGDASNVPITWLKAVLNQVRIMTNNAKVFVLSIIGVQSSGKSTLLNALFGLQLPVSAGRTTIGIHCHLVPVDEGSVQTEYDYVLVVDTEGLGASQFTGSTTFRDNELATFAIGLADATIINMKGENWAEMQDILQIVAHGLVRIRKTKAELELMPRCIFVHQNVLAADAKEKNRWGQENQLALLDTAIKTAAHAGGFTEVTKFNQVIKYDPVLHSWYIPDLWNGRPPKARISQDYIGKVNELRQHLMQLMKTNPSKLTVSSFYPRMSDLWNAMLHNDFVLCFRNTQEIISATLLKINDKISLEVDGFKLRNKLEQTMIRVLMFSFKSSEVFRAENERILRQGSDAVEKNFKKMKATLQVDIDATDISAALKKQYETSLNEIKHEELRRVKDETANDISVHMKNL